MLMVVTTRQDKEMNADCDHLEIGTGFNYPYYLPKLGKGLVVMVMRFGT